MTATHPLLRWLVWVLFTLVLALRPLAAADAQPAATHTIVFFGDSLTAGYGLAEPNEESYPADIQKKIAAAHLPWKVVNAGLSGETTAGGLRRVDWVLRQPMDIFVLALGANDGLRGVEPSVSRTNLQGIIDHVRAKYPKTRIILAGMQMPPAFGPDYTKDFAAMYPALAEKNSLPLIPFLLDGVGGHPELNQRDGIHPTAEGAELVADNVWKVLEQSLKTTN